MTKKKDKKTPKSAFVPGYMDAPLTPELVLDLFEKNRRGKSYGLHELLTILGAGRSRRRELEALLGALVGEGRLVRLKGPAFTLPQALKNIRGHIKIQRQGIGFVRPQNGGEEVYIHPSQLNGAWDGDLVLAAILPGKSGKSREGRVLEVLERRVRELLAELLPQAVKEEGIIKRLARPMDTRLPGYLLVDLEGMPERPSAGDLVLAAPLPAPEGARHGDGVIRAKGISTFGPNESLAMFERLVKAGHNISSGFPPLALKEAEELPPDPLPESALAPTPAEPARRDLRHLDFVTIDGSDARDFDDAICVERSGSGYTLWVAIADVAQYVRPGSEIDREAMKRGNSCYFPASVEPMLPEALCNGLCSLLPGVPRLAVVAELHMGRNGDIKKAAFCRALVKSRARLTYEGVQDLFDLADAGRPKQANTADFSDKTAAGAEGSASMRIQSIPATNAMDIAQIKKDAPRTTQPCASSPDAVQAARPAPAAAQPDKFLTDGNATKDYPNNPYRPDAQMSALLPMLLDAKELAKALLKRREQRGTLAFDLPEARAEVDARGRISALGARSRLFTHKLIEEFMIAANEAVAEHLAGYAEQGLAFLYRAHPAPDIDKLADLAKTLGHMGLEKSLPERPGPRDIQQLLESAQGTPREFVINRLVLRSLMQAVYSPIAEGHFGLASSAYAHFTSPIRRYADLTVHRALLHTLGYPEKIPGHAVLTQIADGLNNCEQEAVAAEREIYKICAALFLKDYIGEMFKGTVAGLSSFGLFVELSDPPCEGFVRLESLPDDYYQLDHERHMLLGQRSGTRFTLGQPLALQLVKADPLRQEVTFELADAGRTRKNSGQRAGAARQPKGNGKRKNASEKKKRKSLPKGSVRRRS